MADVNRGNRPLSPHLSIYRLYLSMAMSIMHRITGVAMALGAVLIAWWFLAAATGPEYFALADGVLTSWLGILVMLGMLVSLAYHLSSGVRHLWWDTGAGFALDRVRVSGLAVLGATAVLTILVLIAALS